MPAQRHKRGCSCNFAPGRAFRNNENEQRPSMSLTSVGSHDKSAIRALFHPRVRDVVNRSGGKYAVKRCIFYCALFTVAGNHDYVAIARFFEIGTGLRRNWTVNLDRATRPFTPNRSRRTLPISLHVLPPARSRSVSSYRARVADMRAVLPVADRGSSFSAWLISSDLDRRSS